MSKAKFKSELILGAKIEKIVPGGQGLATLESGKKAFIWGALPGEIVDFRTTKNKSSYCEGVAERIIESSPARVEPKDVHYLSTSPWQIFDYEEELRQKETIVAECFRQHKIDLAFDPIVTDGNQYFYRNKMEYSLYWNNETNQIQLAFHQRGSHQKVPITHSSIERPEIFAEAERIVAELNAQHAEARQYQSLLVRCDQQGKVSSALFENYKPHPEMELLSDRLLDREYTYSPNGFFQINLPVYELALKEMQKHIDGNQLLDLYSGVGSIGLSIAPEQMPLTLVEVNAFAHQEMLANAKNRPNTTCVLDKSENVTSYLTHDACVILDPPRSGCDQKLLDAINAVQPRSIIYLSCNPITQARDVAILQQNYSIKKAQAFNFFPRTPHIENVCLLSKEK